MSTKKKIFMFILGIEAIAIAGLVIFLFYINNDTVRVKRQLELAQHYLLEKDYEQAIAVFNTIIEIDSKNEDAYIGLAQAYAESGNLEDAVKTLEKGYKETNAKGIYELKVIQTEELSQIEAQKQEETTLTTDMESQPEGTETATVDIVSSENTVQTGFVAQEGELYYYDEQGNMAIGWFEVNSKRYCAKSDGRLYQNGVYEVESIQYLFGKDGLCLGEMSDVDEDVMQVETESEGKDGYRVIIKSYNMDGSFHDYYYLVYNYDSQGRLNEVEIDSDYEVYSYDSQGRISRWEEYDFEENLYKYEVYNYDEQGKLNKNECYNRNKILDSYYVYSYDGQGRLSKGEQYNSNGILNFYYVYNYDSQGRFSKSEHYNPNGGLDSYYVYSYDSQGRLSKVEGDGWYYTCSYDDQDKLSKIESADWYYVYSYDGQGKFIPNELAYFELLGWPEAYILTR